MVDFTNISIGNKYSRQVLAEMWGYKSLDAIRRGVVAPAGLNLIILFITKEKSQLMTKYEDHIDGDILFWEGEKAHGYDHRLTLRKDTIHVFYRERERLEFEYQGRAELRSNFLSLDRPSKFSFFLIDKRITDKSLVEEVLNSYTLSETEKLAIIKSRRGQGIYRTNAINLWKRCCVTGFSRKSILIASHIKPWKICSNEERLNPYNSLLLVPTFDKLFDKGLIGFETNGKILLSDKISNSEWIKIGITNSLKLSNLPSDVKSYLDYHSEYIFNLTDV